VGDTKINSNNIVINQTIGVGGDFGGARQGALQGIREALIDRRVQGV
jgi:hypothetical protein